MKKTRRLGKGKVERKESCRLNKEKKDYSLKKIILKRSSHEPKKEGTSTKGEVGLLGKKPYKNRREKDNTSPSKLKRGGKGSETPTKKKNHRKRKPFNQRKKTSPKGNGLTQKGRNMNIPREERRKVIEKKSHQESERNQPKKGGEEISPNLTKNRGGGLIPKGGKTQGKRCGGIEEIFLFRHWKKEQRREMTGLRKDKGRGRVFVTGEKNPRPERGLVGKREKAVMIKR